MKKIKLLNSGKLFALVDEEDFDKVNQWKWFADTTGYVCRSRPSKIIRLHRFIMNPTDGQEVDHVNGNKLDNRRKNLRTCTRAENAKNRKLNKDNTSGYRGLSWDDKNKAWRTVVMCNGKIVLRKRFKSKSAAILASKWTRKLYYNEFSRGATI